MQKSGSGITEPLRHDWHVDAAHMLCDGRLTISLRDAAWGDVEEIGLKGGPCGGFAMFDWFKSKTRERRKKVRLDRKHVEARARRFLESYLDADEMQKPHFYRAVQDISNMCRSVELSGRFDMDDCRIAETTSQAAMKMVMARTGRIKENDAVGNFVTDACATVAVAYNRAAGVYVGNDELQELGTAAVHLLTMATSYTSADEDGGQHV